MTSVGAPTEPPVTPRHSVFISYASEDRAIGRMVRDALSANGLEVWFDENELGGGDAWDAKIRKQIRDCDYFMPLISATTERRKEGYFRREWRLAVERTMDMADDVLFLLPVVIDETSQGAARVPDKFLTVQWLRLPGGLPNAALASLCRRMQAGDHRTPPVIGHTAAPFFNPVGKTQAPFPSTPGMTQPPQPLPPPPPSAPEKDQHAIPMPPFPPHPEKGFGQNVKYVAEVCWWVLNAAWMLFRRLPKWARVVVVIWLVFSLFTIKRDSPSSIPNPPRNSGGRPPSPQSAEVRRALRKAADEMNKGPRDSNAPFDPSRYVKAGEKFSQILANSMDEAADKLLAIVPFPRGAEEDAEARAVGTIFNAFFGRVMLERSEQQVGLVKQPYTGTTDAALAERGDALDSKFILQGTVDSSVTPHVLNVRLLQVKGSKLAWSGSYPLANADATAIADQIADGVLAALPKTSSSH